MCFFLQMKGHSLDTLVSAVGSEAEFLGRKWDKSLKSFPPCYSQSPLLTDFTPPPPSKRGLKIELSILCTETSTKLYVQEFGFC
jgi:hypothetical protein